MIARLALSLLAWELSLLRMDVPANQDDHRRENSVSLSIRALSVLALAGALFALLFTKSSAEPPDPELQQAFERAAIGEFEPTGTGDGIADDVIDIMRQRGSIADRLSTDPWLDEEKPRMASSDDAASISRKASAAEQMLRAARLLEKVGDDEPDRSALIKRMRSEARKLLTE